MKSTQKTGHSQHAVSLIGARMLPFSSHLTILTFQGKFLYSLIHINPVLYSSLIHHRGFQLPPIPADGPTPGHSDHQRPSMQIFLCSLYHHLICILVSL